LSGKTISTFVAIYSLVAGDPFKDKLGGEGMEKFRYSEDEVVRAAADTSESSNRTQRIREYDVVSREN
jgi:hypothetical protein